MTTPQKLVGVKGSCFGEGRGGEEVEEGHSLTFTVSRLQAAKYSVSPIIPAFIALKSNFNARK